MLSKIKSLIVYDTLNIKTVKSRNGACRNNVVNAPNEKIALKL